MILFRLRFLPIGIGILNCAWDWICNSFCFQLPDFCQVEVKRRIDFHRQKNCLSKFYFVKYESYKKK